MEDYAKTEKKCRPNVKKKYSYEGNIILGVVKALGIIS